VRYARWAPEYERIRDALGYGWAREERARDRLRALLPDAALERPLERLREAVRGRVVVVVGLAPGAGPPPLWRLPPIGPRPAVFAADGAAAVCLNAAIVPDVVVTDLDGPVASEVAANAAGSLVVVHAHGDNVDALERWLPEFAGPLAGSWAGPPGDGLLDEGGFTDGDRAAYLAVASGAPRVLLWGFASDRVAADEPEPVRKLRKLRFASEALGALDRDTPGRLFRWGSDGRIAPYGATDGPTTQ
jgi:2-amino-4-hydroxy-6-hydroxymethyldihydropteridine diphosphokinase